MNGERRECSLLGIRRLVHLHGFNNAWGFVCQHGNEGTPAGVTVVCAAAAVGVQRFGQVFEVLPVIFP